MKKLINITTAQDDLDRYTNRKHFLEAISGLDGIELSYYGDDSKSIIPHDSITGYHITMPNYWYDFYTGNETSLIKEFDTKENWIDYYGGANKDVLIKRIADELKRAMDFNVEYVVFHASDCSFTESLTFDYAHSDEKIIDGVIELINAVFTDSDMDIKLLFENLWVPGMKFTNPEMTEKLMNGINYPHKGIMLDTGHLMHTNTAIKNQPEALKYINAMLDEHDDLCRYIKGIHLNQSISGEYIEKMKAAPPPFKQTFADRHWQTFEHIFKVDRHKPLTCAGVTELIERISPDFLTMEFITSTLEEQTKYKEEQLASLLQK